jgi:hypothetical protein
MASRDDHAAVLVAVLGDNGRPTSVRRYRAAQAHLCEHDIIQLVHGGRALRVTFIDRVDGDGIGNEDRARLTGLVP